MPKRRPPALLTLPLLLLSGLAFGDDTPALQNSSTLSFPDKTNPNPPVFVRANAVSGVENQSLDAQGEVELRRGIAVIDADHLHYTLANDQVTANGNVCIVEQGLTLTGPSLSMFMRQQTGQMDQPQFTYLNPAPVKPADPDKHLVGQARGDAAALQFEGQDQYRLKNATYTTCPVGDNDWYLHVKDLQLDTLNQVGTAHGAEIEFLNTPILYTPWINFPLNDARKSGFLSPVMGTTGNSGAMISLPWYWNIAPNYDATLEPTLISKRGTELGGEFRYLNPTFHGSLDGEILPDQLTGTTRWDLFAQHDQSFTPNVSGHFVYQAVSDDNFFRDLSNQLSVTSLVTLDQEAALVWQGSWWQAIGRVQQFQTLQDPNAPIIPPYARLPELAWLGNKSFSNGLNLNIFSDLTSFVHPTLVNGTRLVLNPSLSLPMTTPFGFITPKVGVSYTDYQLGINNTDPQSHYTRSLPIFSVDSGMYFDRDINFLGTKYQQTLEPRLFYVYIPYQDQSLLPVFDTAELDPINYATLFTENRYVGYDRINDANQLTMAVTSRLVDETTGLERLRFAVGQRLYFSPQLVTLPGEAPSNIASSDILGDIGGQLTQQWRAEAAVSYNTQLGQTDDESLVLSYQPAPGKVFNFSYRTLNGQINQLDISSQWPISRRWYGLMRYDYSLLDKQIVQGLVGVEYNGGCWAIRSMLQTIATAANTNSTSFFFQLELNGLGNLGSNPLDALKLSIPGYTNSNEITPQ